MHIDKIGRAKIMESIFLLKCETGMKLKNIYKFKKSMLLL